MAGTINGAVAGGGGEAALRPGELPVPDAADWTDVTNGYGAADATLVASVLVQNADDTISCILDGTAWVGQVIEVDGDFCVAIDLEALFETKTNGDCGVYVRHCSTRNADTGTVRGVGVFAGGGPATATKFTEERTGWDGLGSTSRGDARGRRVTRFVVQRVADGGGTLRCYIDNVLELVVAGVGVGEGLVGIGAVGDSAVETGFRIHGVDLAYPMPAWPT